MTLLTSLLERVRAASGPLDDDDLAQVIALCHGTKVTSVDISTGDDGSDRFDVYFDGEPWNWGAYRSRCPDVSIDAAVALVEQMGSPIHTVHRNKVGVWAVTLFPDGEAEHAIFPIAILAALLTAMQKD